MEGRRLMVLRARRPVGGVELKRYISLVAIFGAMLAWSAFSAAGLGACGDPFVAAAGSNAGGDGRGGHSTGTGSVGGAGEGGTHQGAASTGGNVPADAGPDAASCSTCAEWWATCQNGPLATCVGHDDICPDQQDEVMNLASCACGHCAGDCTDLCPNIPDSGPAPMADQCIACLKLVNDNALCPTQLVECESTTRD